MSELINYPLKRGCGRICCGGGVLVDCSLTNPRHLSQEGNRTGQAIIHSLFASQFSPYFFFFNRSLYFLNFWCI
jgi:hypothetical protein